jgi:exodeoxyribonuclease V alpha subunit
MGRGGQDAQAQITAPRRAADKDSFAATILFKLFPRTGSPEKEDGFTIARARHETTGEEVVLKGKFGPVIEGQLIQIDRGAWRHDARYGDFFQVWAVSHEDPVTREAIEHYLANLPGIGDVTAGEIVDQLGIDCLSKVDKDPQLLLSIKGISKEKLEEITPVWEELRAERKNLLYLTSLGLGDASARKVSSHFGFSCKDVIESNPYRLTEVDGLGFRQADRIAQSVGIADRDPRRLAAGAAYLLEAAEGEGHICLTREEMLRRAPELLFRGNYKPSDKEIDDALTKMQDDGLIWAEADAGDGVMRYYTRELYTIETRLLENLDELLSAPRIRPPAFFKQPENSPITVEQWQAVENALTERISILTGGPGTGKTRTLQEVLNQLDKEGQSYVCMAPTGKAAKRMEESTGREASTIHRRLGFTGLESPRSFREEAESSFAEDVVVIDEASMMDLRLAERVISHLGPETRLLLVGDPDQLPPVGAGSVLHDLLDSDRVPTARLTQIFRQAEDSLLCVNAHRVRQGLAPYWSQAEAEKALGHKVRDDFVFIETSSAAEATKETLKAAKDLPKEMSLHNDEVLVTAPSRKGECGIHILNQKIGQRRNPNGAEIRGGDNPLRVGDRVMNTQNRYAPKGSDQQDIFNGDTGLITRQVGKVVWVDFGGEEAPFVSDQIDALIPAYASTTHRLQGSEAPAVIVPLGASSRMHSRNLLYTAMTRAQERCVLIGSKETIENAVSRDGSQRNTTLDLRVGRIIPRIRARWEIVKKHKTKSAQDLLFGPR